MQNKKILLVEDNQDDVFLAIRALSKLKMNNVDVVSGGVEALEYLFGESVPSPFAPVIRKPDIILLDQRMPNLDGLQFMECAHHALQTHTIPVIVVTSSTLENEKMRFRELGVTDYIGKPINADGLKRALNIAFMCG